VAGIEPLWCAIGVGWRTGYSHVERLAKAGLVERTFDPGGSVVSITAAGRRAVAAEQRTIRARTHGSGLRHARAVSWVAALATVRERIWVSDLEARSREEWLVPLVWADRRARHRPDLGIELRGARVAIEVELSAKAPRRLDAILGGYEHALASGALAGLIYISDRPDVLDAVNQSAARVGVPRSKLRTKTLESVQEDVRQRTGTRSVIPRSSIKTADQQRAQSQSQP
jgi:DNA-binding MarR family transcriptional regulator